MIKGVLSGMLVGGALLLAGLVALFVITPPPPDWAEIAAESVPTAAPEPAVAPASEAAPRLSAGADIAPAGPPAASGLAAPARPRAAPGPQGAPAPPRIGAAPRADGAHAVPGAAASLAHRPGAPDPIRAPHRPDLGAPGALLPPNADDGLLGAPRASDAPHAPRDPAPGALPLPEPRDGTPRDGAVSAPAPMPLRGVEDARAREMHPPRAPERRSVGPAPGAAPGLVPARKAPPAAPAALSPSIAGRNAAPASPQPAALAAPPPAEAVPGVPYVSAAGIAPTGDSAGPPPDRPVQITAARSHGAALATRPPSLLAAPSLAPAVAPWHWAIGPTAMRSALVGLPAPAARDGATKPTLRRAAGLDAGVRAAPGPRGPLMSPVAPTAGARAPPPSRLAAATAAPRPGSMPALRAAVVSPTPRLPRRVAADAPRLRAELRAPLRDVMTRPLLEPAHSRNAAAFAHARRSRPTLAVILLDDGVDPTVRARVAAMGFAMSFALDPTHPEPDAAAAQYRAAGHEIMVLAPEDPTRFEAAIAALPQAVGLVQGPGAAAPGAPLLAALGQGGYGLVARSGVAAGRGLANVPIDRYIDAEDEDAAGVRANLDRAARDAVDADAVGAVVVGRVRPATIAALQQWQITTRAQWVTLAPVSALLK